MSNDEIVAVHECKSLPRAFANEQEDARRYANTVEGYLDFTSVCFCDAVETSP